MHKGVFGENVQNSKSNTQNAQSGHGTGCATKAGLDKKIGPKWEKWLDNRAFPVYTALVSHNGLVRQKGSFGSVGPRGRHEKFVKNAELPLRIRVDLCASAQI